MEEKEFKIRVAPKEDFILKEILSRVCEKRRSEFVREAIFYWNYILNHSTLSTRYLKTDKNKRQIIDNLFPESYFIKRGDPDMSLQEKFEDVEFKAIRFNIGPDEVELQEICSRAVNLDKFVEEAIFEWDCLINTSNIFLSRFIKRREDSVLEWHIPKPDTNLNNYGNSTESLNYLLENQTTNNNSFNKIETNSIDIDIISSEKVNDTPKETTSTQENEVKETTSTQESKVEEVTSVVGFSNGIQF